VANLDPGLLAEILDDVWSDVVRPIVDVDDALFRLRGGRRDGHGGGCNKGEPDRSAHGSTPQDHRMKKWERRSWTGSAATGLALRGRALLALGRQTALLPGFDAPGEMGVVGQPRGLRHQRGSDRPVARAAGEYDPPALGIGNCSRIEFRHRKIERLRIALDFGLVRLADIHEQGLAFGRPPRHLFRGQIMHVLSAKLSGHGTYSSIRARRPRAS